MLYDLALERLARARPEKGGDGDPRAHIEALLASGSEHPEHLVELLLRASRDGSLSHTLEDRRWLLARLERLTRVSPAARGGLRAAYEGYLFEALRVRAPEELGAIRRGFRRLVVQDPHALGRHLQRAVDRALAAARDGDAYLFHALSGYAARGLAAGGPALRGPLAELLGLYHHLRAFLVQERWHEWAPGTLRTLDTLLRSPAARRRVEREPDLLTVHLEGLWEDLARLLLRGRTQRFRLLLTHLGRLARRLPGVAALQDGFRHLPAVLDVAPGGRQGELAREAMALARGARPGPRPAPWPALGNLLAELRTERDLRVQVRASLRPQARAHLDRYLRLAELYLSDRGALRETEASAAALYPPSRHFPHPTVALYFRRGQREAIERASRGPLDLHLQKLTGSYRLTAFHHNRGEVISGHNLLDEAMTFPFRRALTYSGGVFAVAVVELETLEVASVRMMDGYLDFTGAYYAGIEHLMVHDFQAAIRDFEKALAANPRLQGVNCHIGLCYRRLARSPRDLDRARQHYERELTHHPHSADALNNLGVLTLGSGALEDSLALLERAVVADPDHLGALTNLALTCIALPGRPGSKERFGQILTRIRDLDPASPALGRLLREEGGAFRCDWWGRLRTEP